MVGKEDSAAYYDSLCRPMKAIPCHASGNLTIASTPRPSAGTGTVLNLSCGSQTSAAASAGSAHMPRVTRTASPDPPAAGPPAAAKTGTAIAAPATAPAGSVLTDRHITRTALSGLP